MMGAPPGAPRVRGSQGPPRPVITVGRLGQRNLRQEAAGNDPAAEQIKERLAEGLATPSVAPPPVQAAPVLAPKPIAQQQSVTGVGQQRRRKTSLAGAATGDERSLINAATTPLGR